MGSFKHLAIAGMAKCAELFFQNINMPELLWIDYGRLLVYLYIKDGRTVNEEFAKAGYAFVMTAPPNIKYAELFL